MSMLYSGHFVISDIFFVKPAESRSNSQRKTLYSRHCYSEHFFSKFTTYTFLNKTFNITRNLYNLYSKHLLWRTQLFSTARKVQAKFTSLQWTRHIICGKINVNCYSILKCFYLTHFSTSIFSDFPIFSKAFLNQVVPLESPKNIVSRYFQTKSSAYVFSLSMVTTT